MSSHSPDDADGGPDFRKPSRTVQVYDGLARGIGQTIPGIALALLYIWREQALSHAEETMLLGAMGLLLFSMLGILVLEPARYRKYGRLALVCFALFVLSLFLTRIAGVLNLLTTDENRLLNTGFALFFSALLLCGMYLITVVRWIQKYLVSSP